ncbi:hypothetical protein LTR62_000637 [Meristemomyces frigidus]|uniref:SET domain-containing protein n=1 Tax=Meristemomyces frigidus TaxID=1508187 RepID=A0AAN7TA09_9PEZI|nr:hypothetical protein LTR62_000637 [Meristemomyces frigidus]
MAADSNTILLTQHEVDRVRDEVRGWLKHREVAAATHRKPRDGPAAIRAATGASLLMDMGGASDPDLVGGSSARQARPLLVIDHPYAPCGVPLEKLASMSLADLCLEQHHAGKFLRVKKVSPVILLATRSWTMVQDEAGDVERLEVYVQTQLDGIDVLESASEFYVKEPYLSLNRQGETMLRIDHPSDLIPRWEDGVDDSRPGPTRTDSHNEDTAASGDVILTLKEKGNASLKQQDYRTALAMYGSALENSANDTTLPGLAKDIYRNRAQVSLLTGYFDQARSDALSAILDGQDETTYRLNGKAYFRAGCAAYKLGRYEEASDSFTKQLQLVPGDREAELYLRRTTARIGEQDEGKYNIRKLRVKYASSSDPVDAASYTARTALRESPGLGRGLFAVEDIPIGGLVMCEKALCVSWSSGEDSVSALSYDTRDNEIRVTPISLVKAVTAKLSKNPSLIPKVMDLDGGSPSTPNSDTSPEPGAENNTVVNTFHLHDIVTLNAFALSSHTPSDSEKQKEASTGLWPHAAYINHSCTPNIAPEFLGDLLLFHATRPIKAGEELFHCYNATRDYDARQAALKTTWGFRCKCALCIAEEADGVEVRKRREELVVKAEGFVQRTAVPARRVAVVEARRLLGAIEGTYDEVRYRGLSRAGIRGLEEWLARAKVN